MAVICPCHIGWQLKNSIGRMRKGNFWCILSDAFASQKSPAEKNMQDANMVKHCEHFSMLIYFLSMEG